MSSPSSDDTKKRAEELKSQTEWPKPPDVYYAHLTSKHAKAHIDMPNTERVRITK